MTVYINGVEQRNLDTPEEIRDALLLLPDNERVFVITDNIEAGERKVVSVRRNAAGHIEYDAETIPE